MTLMVHTERLTLNNYTFNHDCDKCHGGKEHGVEGSLDLVGARQLNQSRLAWGKGTLEDKEFKLEEISR